MVALSLFMNATSQLLLDMTEYYARILYCVSMAKSMQGVSLLPQYCHKTVRFEILDAKEDIAVSPFQYSM